MPILPFSPRRFQAIGLAGGLLAALAGPPALAAPPAKHAAGAQKKGKGPSATCSVVVGGGEVTC